MKQARPRWWDVTALAVACAAALVPGAQIWSVLAVVALATLGLGHGAFDLDLDRGRRLQFVARYLSVVLATLLAWWIAPRLTVVAFVAVSIWHFGQADLVHLPLERWRTVAYVSRGLLLVGFPLGLHLPEATPVLQQLGICLAVPYWAGIAFGVACGVQHVVVLSTLVRGKRRRRELLSLAPSVLFLGALPLLSGFVLAFTFGHAAAHLWAMRHRAFGRSSVRRAIAMWAIALASSVGFATLLGGLRRPRSGGRRPSSQSPP